MAAPESEVQKQIRIAFEALEEAVREMTPAGKKAVPVEALKEATRHVVSAGGKRGRIDPIHFNLLAHQYGPTCLYCNFPGHQSSSIRDSAACRVANMSIVGFWEDIAAHISTLYQNSDRFHKALTANQPTYEMRLNWKPKGGSFEEIFVDRLTKNYIKYQAHMDTIMPKANVYLPQNDMERLVDVTKKLDAFLLNGKSWSRLFEEYLEKLDSEKLDRMDTSN